MGRNLSLIWNAFAVIGIIFTALIAIVALIWWADKPKG